MKLQKLKISELSNYRHLTNQEMRQYVGGYVYDNRNCFFNCMEYFAKEICGREDIDSHYFGKAYYEGDSAVGTWKDYLNGPEIQYNNGKINLAPFKFFSHYFNVEGCGWTVGSDIQSLVNGSVENTAVMGWFITDGSTMHCAILQKYDAATDTYTYYDPSCSGTDEEKTKTVSGSNMKFGVRAGCKIF